MIHYTTILEHIYALERLLNDSLAMVDIAAIILVAALASCFSFTLLPLFKRSTLQAL